MKWMKGIVEIMECSVQLAVVVSDYLNVSRTRSIPNEVQVWKIRNRFIF